MSNRFTKYTADKLRADGWLDKEQADTLRTRLQQVESERDKAEADAAVMRETIRLICAHDYWANVDKPMPDTLVSAAHKALATNAGKPLLERLQEAEWLLVNCPNSCDPEPAVFKEWWNRRDAFLNPKPQDVM